MTPDIFNDTPIWHEDTHSPCEGQRFFARHRKNEDRPGNYIEVAWVGTETSGGYQHAIMLTKTGERLIWDFRDVIYRSHRHMLKLETVTLPRELTNQQVADAAHALRNAAHCRLSLEETALAVWAAIKQHGEK